MRMARLGSTTAIGLLWLAAEAGAQGAPGAPSQAELTLQLEQVAKQVKNAEENLRLVETQYTQRPEPTGDEALLRRFSDAEIQYLLEDYRSASVLFYDLISDERFRQGPRFTDALFFLGDSLYQQHNYIGARLYLRELLGHDTQHYRLALARYLDIASRLNELAGIDEYILRARELSGGELTSDLAYLYGKWLFRRADLPTQDRVSRMRAVLLPLAKNPQGALRLQAAYFLATGEVHLGNFEAAIEQFKAITVADARNDAERKVKELAQLALGRLLLEAGRFPEAVERYEKVARDSEQYIDGLYESAWAHVRNEDFVKAKNATEYLTLSAPESTLAPEATILQGHLQLKLKNYDQARETYDQVISTYAPVRDEIDSHLTASKDPVAYFNKQLAANRDLTALLPDIALKWATTAKDVADAVRMQSDLKEGAQGLEEANELAVRILKALDERALETFPELQDGYMRADAVDSALTQSEHRLLETEARVLEPHLTEGERAELGRLRTHKAALEERFKNLPQTPEAVEARRRKLEARVEQADKEAFQLGFDLQNLAATLRATERLAHESRAERKPTPEAEQAFAEQVRREQEEIAALEQELSAVRTQLADERGRVATSLSGEDLIRAALGEQLVREHALLAQAEGRVDAPSRQALERAHQVRQQIQKGQGRVRGAKQIIREQVARRGDAIRAKVLAEQRLLGAFQGESHAVSAEANDLVARIAHQSFLRVRRQFYELVLKADVGIVDVAFTRKQDKTQEIQQLSTRKDRELRALDAEFREVLEDTD
jgi:TolA-binding protein